MSTLDSSAPDIYCLAHAGTVIPLRPAPNEREVFAMRKLILTGALFARLTRKDRLTLPYSYY